MLSDEEAEAIKSSLRSGTRGALLIHWIEALLEDRRERVEQIGHIRRRLRQAFEYLDRLCEPKRPAAREATERGEASAQ